MATTRDNYNSHNVPSSPETNEPAFMIEVSSENIEPSTPGGHKRDPSVITFHIAAKPMQNHLELRCGVPRTAHEAAGLRATGGHIVIGTCVPTSSGRRSAACCALYAAHTGICEIWPTAETTTLSVIRKTCCRYVVGAGNSMTTTATDHSDLVGYAELAVVVGVQDDAGRAD